MSFYDKYVKPLQDKVQEVAQSVAREATRVIEQVGKVAGKVGTVGMMALTTIVPSAAAKSWSFGTQSLGKRRSQSAEFGTALRIRHLPHLEGVSTGKQICMANEHHYGAASCKCAKCISKYTSK